MGMIIEGEERIEAPVETVWKGLNDPDVLKDCIPGCERLEKTADDLYRLHINRGRSSVATSEDLTKKGWK